MVAKWYCCKTNHTANQLSGGKNIAFVLPACDFNTQCVIIAI